MQSACDMLSSVVCPSSLRFHILRADVNRDAANFRAHLKCTYVCVYVCMYVCVCVCVCIYIYIYIYMCGPGSSVGIATDYGLDGPGIESRWGRDFPPLQTGPGAHPASSTMGTGSFPGVKCGRGVLLTTHPLLAPRS